MPTVKKLKPNYIKSDPDYVNLIFGNRNFTIFINNQEYQFIPIGAKEIKIDRKTRKIANIEDKFAFQKGQEIIYITMNELVFLPDFMIQLYDLAKPYYMTEQDENDLGDHTDMIISELERLNIKRLIDKALDERDQQAFEKLVNLL